MVITTFPSSPTGWLSTKSAGSPSSAAGSTETERTPSRMFLENSWATAVSRSASSRSRAAPLVLVDAGTVEVPDREGVHAPAALVEVLAGSTATSAS